MRILVTGATGTVGRHVVEYLLAEGVDVRALTRSPETAGLPSRAEIVKGDLENPEARLFQGVDRMYLLAMGDTKLAVDTAKRAGVQRVVTLSSLAADEFHRGVEIIVEQSGLEWTHVRPGMFMANLIDWADDIRNGVVREPYARARQAPVHEKDIAAVAVKALLDDEHVGQVYPLTGPQSLTKIEQAQTIGKAVGKTITFEEIRPEAWLATSQMPDVAEFLLHIWETSDDAVLPTIPDVLDRPAKTLAEWATDHSEDFQ